MHKVTYTTTLAGANAMVLSMGHDATTGVKPLQEIHKG